MNDLIDALVAYRKSSREGDWRECQTLPEKIWVDFTEEVRFEVSLNEYELTRKLDEESILS